MRIWLGLIIAPLLALTDLTVAFGTVSWACAHQAAFALHVVHFAFLAAAFACTLGAWQALRAATATSGDATASQVQFLAGIAAATGALSTVAIAAMWVPVSIVATCLS